MFLCLVFVGDSFDCKANDKLTSPPLKKKSKTEKYDKKL